jgi:glycosyltransferase involved in cell wall biosynthesis
MRILAMHDRYRIRGGEDECFDSELRMLREAGHEVRLLVDSNDRIAADGGVRAAADAVWSVRSYRAARAMLREARPDIVHVHNFFPRLSPSVYYAARAAGVPVVQTLHNFRLLCPRADLFRAGRRCEDCVGRLPWPGVVNRCYRGSAAASAAVAAMIGIHRALGTWSRQVAVYVATSEFARARLVRGGLPAERLVVKPNFVAPDPGPGAGERGYALYVGRLSREKGVATLLRAWSGLGSRLPLMLVGDPSLAPDLAGGAAALAGVRCLGRRTFAETCELMRGARVVVVPSECDETFCRVVVEAFAAGTPVIASRVGAIPELIEDGVTGLLFAPGEPDDLVAKLDRLLGSEDGARALGARARAEYQSRYTAERNHAMLMAIYDRARAAPPAAA